MAERVAVACGHYVSRLGYGEVGLAKALAKRVTTRVFTGTAPNPSYRRLVAAGKPGLWLEEGVVVHRFRPLAAFGGAVLPPTSLSRAVAAFAPTAVVALGPTKVLPLFALSVGKELGARTVAVVGEYREQPAGRTVPLRSLFAKTCHRITEALADELVVVVPAVVRYLAETLGKEVTTTHVPLGYDADDFYFDERERERTREELGLGAEEPLVVSSGHAAPHKRWDEMADAVPKGARFVVAGTAFEGRGAKGLGFLTPAKLRALFCAADLGLWLAPSISVVQALGTGLPLLLPKTEAFEGYLDGGNGVYFGADEPLASAVERALETTGGANRERLASVNARFSYDELSRRYLRLIRR